MEKQPTVLEEIARKPITPAFHYDGSMQYKSPRMTRDAQGTIDASPSGITGHYEIEVQPGAGFKMLDTALQDGDTPGKLVTPDKQASIICPGSPSVTVRPVYEKSNTLNNTTANIQYFAHGCTIGDDTMPITYHRLVFANAPIPMSRSFCGTFNGRTIYIANHGKIDGQPFAAAAHDGLPFDELEWRSVSYALHFLCGRKTSHYLTEGYNANADLAVRRYRQGYGMKPEALGPFNVHCFPPPTFVEIFVQGFYEALRAGFPLDVMLEHLFNGIDAIMDFSLQSLILAIHAAIESWHVLSPPLEMPAGVKWLAENEQRILDVISPLIESAPTFVKNAILSGIEHAADYGTGKRERRFLGDWGLTPLSKLEKRSLALRNQLIHNGYFRTRFENLSPEEQQERVTFIRPLLNLNIKILCRAVGYTGPFIDQCDFHSPIQVAGSAMFPLAPSTAGDI